MEIDNNQKQLYAAAESYLDENRKLLLDKTIQIITNKLTETEKQKNISSLKRSIELAIIVTQEIGLGFSAILATLLYRVYAENNISIDEINRLFPENFAEQIINILKGLQEANKLDTKKIFGLKELDFSNKYEQLTKRAKKFATNEYSYLIKQGEYFKNYYLTVGKDIRVLLLKLAYHIFEVKHIDTFTDEQKQIIARQARYIYAPIAHQIGLYNIKTLLEEVAMQYLNTKIYHNIVEDLDKTESKREAYIKDFIAPIKKNITALGYSTNIKGRSKSIHSIWNKMKKQRVEIDKIYDIFAIRVILTDNFENVKDEKAACWNVYSKITDIWTPNPNRLRDWVSSPKPSGYESLHTTVIGPEGKWVEVQIRTQRMDNIAERGSAAHWKYKEVKGQNEHSSWLDKMYSILENPDDETINKAKTELYSDIIFVFTPKGEAKKLTNNATVLDFAYKIHTKVGNKCTGAKINNKLVGIKHKLENGDTVEILTSNTQFPKNEWLEIASSTQTKGAIKRALNAFEKERINEGKQILKNVEEKVRNKYNKADFYLDDRKNNILRKKFGITKIDEFFIKIQKQEISISTQLLYDVFLQQKEETTVEKEIEKMQLRIDNQNVSSVKSKDCLTIDKNMTGIKYELAKCCNPIPGDNIFAFITATKGTKIHKINCPNAPDLFKNYSYRITNAKWKNIEFENKFKVKLKLIGDNNPGIVSQISTIIFKEPFVDLYSINVAEAEKPTFVGEIGLLVNGLKFLNELIIKLKAIQGIINVERIDKI